jgi:hypothetical protein
MKQTPKCRNERPITTKWPRPKREAEQKKEQEHSLGDDLAHGAGLVGAELGEAGDELVERQPAELAQLPQAQPHLSSGSSVRMGEAVREEGRREDHRHRTDGTLATAIPGVARPSWSGFSTKTFFSSLISGSVSP